MSKQQCSNCRFFISDSSKLMQGFCCIKPPVVLLIPQAAPNGMTALSVNSFFPPIGNEAWCGAWEGAGNEALSVSTSKGVIKDS